MTQPDPPTDDARGTSVGWLGFLVEQARLSIATSEELRREIDSIQGLEPEVVRRVVLARRGTAICYALLGLILPFLGTAFIISQMWWTPGLVDGSTFALLVPLSAIGLVVGFRVLSLVGLVLASWLVRLYVRSLEK
ncbi:MAG: hypothetical protein U1E65_15525 [Myxococcota bacterium]